MSDPELTASWERIERYLRQALAELDLPDDAEATALEYIDQNELGLAFEFLTSALVQRGAQLPDAAREPLARAAAEMDLEAYPDWRRLSG